MTDLFNNEVSDGDIIVFAGKSGDRPVLKLAIVTDAKTKRIWSANHWYEDKWNFSTKGSNLQREGHFIIVNEDAIWTPHVKNALVTLRQRIAGGV